MSLVKPAISSPASLPRQWKADLTLEFAYSPFGTQLIKTTRHGPLSVQKAFYPEGQDCAHVYLLHPPAGIVSGDDLTIRLKINDKAQVLLTTPGGNRFYRAREDQSIGVSAQKQTTEFVLGGNAMCENFPQETSVYLGWDITCLGLPSSNEPFSQGRYTQLNRLFCDNKLIYHDRIAITPENQLFQHAAGLANHSVFGTFLAFSPTQSINIDRKQVVIQLNDLIAAHYAQDKISVSDIDGLLVIRYLGEQAQECKTLFIGLWQILRPIYQGKEAILPRIWHT